jgi:hypothetical protein
MEIHFSEEQVKEANAMQYISDCINEKGYYTLEEFEEFIRIALQ